MKNMGATKQNAISVHPQEMPCDVNNEILQDLPISQANNTYSSPRSALGSMMPRTDETRGDRDKAQIHIQSAVYSNNNDKNSNNEVASLLGDQFRSESAHTKYGTPWITNMQANQSKANNNTDKISSKTGVSDFKTASRSHIVMQKNNSKALINSSLDADIESKAYDIDFTKSGGSVPMNNVLSNQQVHKQVVLPKSPFLPHQIMRAQNNKSAITTTKNSNALFPPQKILSDYGTSERKMSSFLPRAIKENNSLNFKTDR